MTVARVDTKKGRKPWVCGMCKKDIPVGTLHRTWSVGFRGATQRRCLECPAPLTSELESSAVSAVYAAIEGTDFESATSREDLDIMVNNVKEAVAEVADEYESNEMFEMNEALQERAEILRSVESELESWADSLEDEPTANEDGSDGEGYEEWLDAAAEAAKTAIDDMELP